MLGSVYVDFDGTIAPSDPTDTLFARFCDPSWRTIEREWQEGRRTHATAWPNRSIC
jgi:2-hydroxy-3-keto-5-methylthiopentenyl-1-phosphate phosphatase